MRAAPLAGVRVLEVGVFMAAPFATMQLADLGAEVVKVENPEGGEPVRSTGPFVVGHSSPYLRLNRSKRSVALDLKSDEGREAFLRLAAGCDVVVENLRPGAMRRLGLGYEEVRSVSPGVVYASASGFGQDGPLADRPGLDIMAQARGGLMSITGTPDGDPVKIGVPCATWSAASTRRSRSPRRCASGTARAGSVRRRVASRVGRLTRGVGGRPLLRHRRGRRSARLRPPVPGAVPGLPDRRRLGDPRGDHPRTWAGLCKVLRWSTWVRRALRDSSPRHARREELRRLWRNSTRCVDDRRPGRRLEAVDVPCAPIADYEPGLHR